MAARDDPFRDVHRARRRVACVRIVTVATALAVSAGMIALADVVPRSTIGAVPASAVESVGTAPSPPAEPAAAVVAELPAAATLVPSAPPATQPSPQPASVGPAAWAIEVDTTGYQAEIDRCLWVRMNLGGVAPIVGAHNYCGGDVVLEMTLGDTVVLTGTDLDGSYVVAEARDARTGDNAALALDGMVADVVLQTCYWNADGRLRLVGLTLEPDA